jgi:glutamine synthetase
VEKNTYFENRFACGLVNPYICLAATVAAGIDGMKRQLPLPPETKGEAYKLGADVCPPLPRSLGEALNALNANEVMVDALGKEFVKCFTVLKKHEIELCKKKAETDPDWERKYYFESYN